MWPLGTTDQDSMALNISLIQAQMSPAWNTETWSMTIGFDTRLEFLLL